MNFDTPLVEYLIIGMHTASWITIIIFKALKIPIKDLLNIDTTTILLLLPFVYILGMMVDDLVFSVLKRKTEKIKNEVMSEKSTSEEKRTDIKQKGSKNSDPRFMDEKIALKSPDLYNAYEARVRRIKIIAAAFFNWPLLGLSGCIYIGTQNIYATIAIILLSAIFMLISYRIWNNLTRRAYSFRKKAGAVIAEQEKLG